MASHSRIAAVTGGNKGIGFACVRQLALQYPQSAYNNGPFLIYLTARNEERGKAALEAILRDPQLKEAKALRVDGGLTDVKYLSLDIDSSESISSFADTLKKEHPQGIDILINNAGIALTGFDADVVKQTLHCNYYGTLQAVRQILPHIRDGGRLVNVSSQSGQLGTRYSARLTSRFHGAVETEQVTKLMKEFQTAVSDGTWEKEWPTQAYGVSKAGVIGFTRTIAAKNAADGSKTLINVCCPGFVNTDMTKGRGVKTPDQGAMTPVLLALGDIGDSNGQFWISEKKICALVGVSCPGGCRRIMSRTGWLLTFGIGPPQSICGLAATMAILHKFQTAQVRRGLKCDKDVFGNQNWEHSKSGGGEYFRRSSA